MAACVEHINPSGMRPPAGAYSQISRFEDLIYMAGQAGVAADGSIGADVTIQLRLAFDNVKLALESQGLSFDNVLNITIYLVDRELIAAFEAAMDALMPSLFQHGYPASTLLVVNGLARLGLLVEIAAVAHR